MKTLRDILATHPEWADMPVAIYRTDGTYDFLGGSGTVYLDDRYSDGEDGEHTGVMPVVVFAGN